MNEDFPLEEAEIDDGIEIHRSKAVKRFFLGTKIFHILVRVIFIVDG